MVLVWAGEGGGRWGDGEMGRWGAKGELGWLGGRERGGRVLGFVLWGGTPRAEM